MAGYTCTMCETNSALLLDTNLDDGECQSICGPCLPGYALSMALALTMGMTPEECEAFGELFDGIHANDVRASASPAPTAARRSRSRIPAQSAGDATHADTGTSTPDQSPQQSSPNGVSETSRTSDDTSAASTHDASDADAPF